MLFFFVLVTGLCFTSCKKEKEDFLVGTTWVCNDYGDVYTLKFITDSRFTVEERWKRNDGNYDTYQDAGTYTYSKPVITIYYDGESDSVTGTINDKTLILGGGVYLKQ